MRFAAVCLVAAACSGSKPSAESVDAINTLVPAALHAKLVFAARTITVDDFVGGKITPHTYHLAAPTGWRAHDGELTPAGGLGDHTTLTLSSSCAPPTTGDLSKDVDSAGMPCSVRDWTATVDAQLDEQRGISKAVVKDEKSVRRRSMIATIEGMAYARDGEGGMGTATLVWVMWWNEGESEYHSCHAILEREITDAAAAFERACQSVTVEY